MNVLQLENKLSSLNIFPTAREICRVIGMAEESYSRKKKAGTEIKFADIKKLEQEYNITLVDNNMLFSSTINILPICASCGNGITIDTSLIDKYDVNAQYSIVVAKGNSMTPTINNEDIVIIKKYDGNFIDGIYCFSIEDDMFIKRLSKNINQIVCTSDNPEFDKIVLKGQELDTLNILGRVVTVIRKFA